MENKSLYKFLRSEEMSTVFVLKSEYIIFCYVKGFFGYEEEGGSG